MSSIQNLAPVTDCGNESELLAYNKFGRISDAARLAKERRISGKIFSQRERYVRKWARLWRTIILSSLGKTLYHYSQYIRTLNLRDLERLLTDSKFEGKTRRYSWIESILYSFHFCLRKFRSFFQDELAQFKVEGVPFSKYSPLIAMEIVNTVGEGESAQSLL